MKFILGFLFLFTPLLAAPQDEMLVIMELIQTTKQNLVSQEKLLQLMVDFKNAREAFIKDPNSGKLATALVKKATYLYSHVEKEHLAHLFSTDFLVELEFYNQVGKQIVRKQ